jgi:hypothetical protein
MEEFKNQYDSILKDIEILNNYSDYVGTTNSTIWKNVGVSDVAKYIKYVKEYSIIRQT